MRPTGITRTTESVITACRSCAYRLRTDDVPVEIWSYVKFSAKHGESRPVTRTYILGRKANWCPECFGRLSHKVLRGNYSANTPCGPVCKSARGNTCSCTCAGLNHGTKRTA